ncbi:Ribosome maturation factor RimP [Streptomyces sp. RB5]|uniref:Ribosome maturation factor RimP n=1 Tax=Streptomyces smaragdinus TaxID=2585196 RepID=A0A7K0CR72_9ACTN|nr:ribosome maturation factor RimP [Streptomyces smaragdinus]MQY15988.1 Ribosome maturation factor RimP [Streptomyces smaragdinus]
MSTTQNERLRGLLEPLVAEFELDLEDVELETVGRKRILRVVVDSADGVDLDACAELSRAVSDTLDAPEHRTVMGDAPYELEVGSPGAERPLKEPRHFERALGRLMRARLTKDAGGDEIVARILAVDAEGLDTEVQGIKGRKSKPRRVAFAEIERARVEVEFNRKQDENETMGEEA